MIRAVHFADIKQVYMLARALKLPAYSGMHWTELGRWPRWLKKMLDVAKRDRPRKGRDRMRWQHHHKPRG